MTNANVLNFLKAARREQPSQIPVALFGGSPYNIAFSKVKSSDYYFNSEIKLKVFTRMFEEYSDAVFLPGYWPDFGPVDIPSAFGCEIFYPEVGSPHAKQVCSSIHDVNKLKPANPYKSGIVPKILAEWEYLWEHVDKKWVEEYGYLNGIGWTAGPVEAAALIRGYQEFLSDMIQAPHLIHKLLDMVTEFVLEYLRAQEKINGKLKRVCVVDHLASIISPQHVQEFFIPYMQKVFYEFSYAEVRLWHNEGKCKHFLEAIPKLGCNVWQFGDDDIVEAKSKVGARVTLLGNIDPVNLIKFTPEQVEKESEKVLNLAGQDGIFILSAGGGFAPETPAANIKAIIRAAQKFSLT
ncbi:MAG: uroporphyrinogen decarboxylase family protein [Bacillota bacterium]|jgi:uroporphyrinogen decarboxylase